LIRSILAFALALGMALTAKAQSDSNPTFGAESAYWNQSIADVKVVGLVTADTFLILNSSGLVPGDLLTAGMVQDAVKGVYSLGLFSDVEVIADSSTRRGVVVTINVREFPRLHEIKISGNKKFKRNKIKENLSLFEGRLVSPEAIKTNIEKIKSLYSEKGYLLVDIEIKQTPSAEDSTMMDAEIKISEGKKVKIAALTFAGNTQFTDKKLRGKMTTRPKSFFRSGSFNRDKYLEDKDKVTDFYKDHGYIDAVILGDSIWYSADKTQMYIRVSLSEGSKYYFGNISWEGNKLFPDDKFRKSIKFKPSGVYNQKKYDETIGKFHEIYQDEGYWYAQIDEKTNPRGDTLDFHLSITENNPVHIRLINIEGNTKTQEKVIRRELSIKPGTVFKRSILGRSLRDLMILNFFGNAEPGWDILPDGDIDLKINITEKETGQFSIGAGYSQTDKFVGTVGVGIPNLFGTGQTASVNVEFGANRNTFDLSYSEPWLFDTPTSISGNLYTQDRDWYGYFTERRTGGDIQVGRRLRWPDNYFRIFAGYRLERVNYLNINSTYRENNKDNPYSIVTQDWPLATSALSTTVIRDSRDLSQFATKGSILSVRNELAGTVLGGDWDYFTQVYTGEYYKTVFWKVVFMARSKFGWISGINHPDSEVPYSERFAPGGVDSDGTIRGYDDGAVGPYDSNSNYLRGRYELIYNAELTIPIAEQQFYVILFSDAGNAYLAKKNIHLFKGYKRSVGTGFRILIPMVGIMGFDFGYSFDRNGTSDSGQWKTHFQIGKGF
jgi:outer membrane protein insertion porin family